MTGSLKFHAINITHLYLPSAGELCDGEHKSGGSVMGILFMTTVEKIHRWEKEKKIKKLKNYGLGRRKNAVREAAIDAMIRIGPLAIQST
jgi:hypothetical protein